MLNVLKDYWGELPVIIKIAHCIFAVAMIGLVTVTIALAAVAFPMEVLIFFGALSVIMSIIAVLISVVEYSS